MPDAGALSVPAARVPLRGAAPRTAARGKLEPETRSSETGVFDEDRYFDVEVEYAKEDPDDMLIRLTVHQPGAEAAPLTSCRSAGSGTRGAGRSARRGRSSSRSSRSARCSIVRRRAAARRALALPEGAGRSCSSPRTRLERRGGCAARRPVTPYVKDGINDHVIVGRRDASTRRRAGPSARRYSLLLEAAQTAELRLRLRYAEPREDDAVRRRLRRVFARAPARGRRVLRRGRRRRRPADEAGVPRRRSPACTGASSLLRTTWRAGWAGTRRSRRRPRRGGREKRRWRTSTTWR